MFRRKIDARRGVAALTVLAFAALPALSAADGSAPLASLPSLKIDPARVTVSGLSSGGAMAVQFHVAHSQIVHGVGALAAPPYYCAEGSVAAALGRCMRQGGEIPVERLLDAANRLAAEGRIDAPALLQDDRVWLYRGAVDPYVDGSVGDALERFYRPLVAARGLARIELAEAGHHFPGTGDVAPACGTSEPPYVARCDFDGAGQMFAHLYGPPATPSSTPGDLQAFEQDAYASRAGSRSLTGLGWLYVPADCAAGRTCGLQVVFHGCRQGSAQVGDAFIRQSGYLAAADAHRVVLLFPQVQPSTSPLNPMGCWDWWGYEGEDYATQGGRQIRTVRAMLEALADD
jgi:poly(3-hydroxybutyrate) depolymerase